MNSSDRLLAAECGIFCERDWPAFAIVLVINVEHRIVRLGDVSKARLEHCIHGSTIWCMRCIVLYCIVLYCIVVINRIRRGKPSLGIKGRARRGTGGPASVNRTDIGRRTVAHFGISSTHFAWTTVKESNSLSCRTRDFSPAVSAKDVVSITCGRVREFFVREIGRLLRLFYS